MVHFSDTARRFEPRHGAGSVAMTHRTALRIPAVQCLLTFEALVRRRQFTEPYTEIDMTRQVSMPLLDGAAVGRGAV